MDGVVMREILFKAKRKNWRDLPKEEWWVEGDLIHEPFGTVIQYYADGKRVKVIIAPETLCQYTGLNDKNGNRIWENDILHIVEQMGNNVYHNGKLISCFCWDNKSNFKVEFTPGALMNTQRYVYSSKIECMVIGNVFDNPEMVIQT